MHRQEIADARDPEARRQELIAEYREQFANPFKAAELGFVDEVIRPSDLRRRLTECLRMLKDKRDAGPRRKHGNIPL
jgi:acetyl-CoA/propionyl-CoA carboxylase carboxyl transferase subunit